MKLAWVLAMVLGAAVILASAFVYRPLVAEIRGLSAETAKLDAQAHEARAYIHTIEKDDEERTLLSENRIPFLISQLTKAGKAKGVDFVSMAPEDIEQPEEKPYRMLPVNMEIHSSFMALGDFMQALSGLESLIIVRRFAVSPVKDDPSRLRTNLTLHVYVAPAS